MSRIFQKTRENLKDLLLEKTAVAPLARLGVKRKTAEQIGVAFYLGLSALAIYILGPLIVGRIQRPGGSTLSIPTETAPQDIGKQETTTTSKCRSAGVFCSDFKGDKWEGKESFTILHEGVEIFQLHTDEKTEGKIMFFKEEIHPGFVAILETTPLSEEFNIVFQYGNYYRCIFGDGNNKTIGCQINDSWPVSSPSDWRYVDLNGNVLPKGGRWHFYMGEGVEKDTPLTIRLEQVPTKDSRDIEIRIRVTFFPVLSPRSVEREVEYTLTLKRLSSEIEDRIGVGLIDPEKTNDIRASFQYFEVEERVLD